MPFQSKILTTKVLIELSTQFKYFPALSKIVKVRVIVVEHNVLFIAHLVEVLKIR